MQYDKNIPSLLLEMQKWFVDHITAPSFECKEASQYIRPSPTLDSRRRLEIYHQQYWLRVLEILQDHYPTLTTLLGKQDFNHLIGIPYLHQNPSQHWSLAYLGLDLPLWLVRNYCELDASLIIDLSAIDCAYQQLFLAANPTPYSFFLTRDLFSFRSSLLASQTVPQIAYGTFQFTLYRNAENKIIYIKES